MGFRTYSAIAPFLYLPLCGFEFLAPDAPNVMVIILLVHLRWEICLHVYIHVHPVHAEYMQS